MARISGTVLIADDDSAVSSVLAALLSQEGYDARTAASGEEALRMLDLEPSDILITDLQMPGMAGMEVLAHVNALWPDMPVIVLTAHGTVHAAVEAMKAGAQEFMLKPFDRTELLYVVNKAFTSVHRTERLPPQPPVLPGGMVVQSSAMREVQALIRRVAPATSTVLIQGESGTGKELVARAIHQSSLRKGGALVTIHCGALPEGLLESELFGYEKGAFTGAATRKPGRVEFADHGTLFLDEIGDIPLALQVKLLRLIQEKEFHRLGGTRALNVDVRIVAATHRDLESMVQRGLFREDLFYRLNVVPICVPPLRDRPEDIGALAQHFCSTLARLNGRDSVSLHPSAIDLLRRQSWPGNVRQLQNLIERLVVMSDNATITREVVEQELVRRPPSMPPIPARLPSEQLSADVGTLDARRREAERDALLGALKRARNNRTLAARLLGVSRRTLYTKLQDYDLL